MSKRISYGKAVYGKEEVKAVNQVLNSSTQMSKFTKKFEEEIAKVFGKRYGVMVNSGTSALFLAVEALNLRKNSNVITPVLTFATTVSCLVKNNLIPNFVDVDLNTLCIDTKKIEASINSNTSALCIPDLLGSIANWSQIKKIAKKYDLKIIHDSADTLGSTINKKPVGNYSDISITSFYGSHVITGAGNGGMILTNSTKIYEKLRVLRSWGRRSSLFENSEDIKNRFNAKIDNIDYDSKFIFDEIGYQMEPSEISSAFGLVQLKKLKRNISQRNKNFNLHVNFFKKRSNFFYYPIIRKNIETSFLAYPIIIKNPKINRNDLQIFLEKNGIQTRVIFTGNILRQPGFRKIRHIGKINEFKVADYIMKNGLLVGCHHGLEKIDIKYIHDTFDHFLSLIN